MYDYVGHSKRLALPCCVYNKIRDTFHDENSCYRGYEEDADDEDEEIENSTDSEEDEQ